VYAGTCAFHADLNTDPTTTSYGIYKSTNGGLNWQSANDPQTSDTCVNNLAIDPKHAGTLYAATAAEGLYKTTNGGLSWTQLSGLPNDIRAVALRPGNPDVIYVGTQGSGVYVSTNAGSSWSPLLAGMEPNDRIWSIVFDPAHPDTVYAGSFYTGVYQWLPDENRWTHIDLGLRTRSVTDLAISNNGQALYAATYGEGVFRLGDVSSQTLFLPIIVR
jgi:photosystem II stability/assembly factor-like uncharacterized protein